MKKTLTSISAVCAALVAAAGTGTMATAPMWDLADHGGARAVSSASPLEVPQSDLPGFNFSAFTAEAVLTFGDVTDYRGFTVMDQMVSETGWGVRVQRASGSGNPVSLMCNGERYGCSYGMGGVTAGSTHSFTITARKGWIVVYMDGKVQKSFMMTATPNLGPIRVGAPLGGWTELQNVTLESFKVWGEEEEYYAPGEPAEAATGYVGGKGWLVEAPTTPLVGRPNVLYVGDSISDGYSSPFKANTKGIANLYHWTASFGTPGTAGVPTNKINEVCALAEFDKIVFNNGLHSLHWTTSSVADSEVVASYSALVDCFRAAATNATVHYLATTPYTEAKDANGVVNGLGDKNPVVLRLNAIASDVMEAKNVPYIDAYALFVNRLDLARGDQYHWNATAYEMLAQTVKEALGLTNSLSLHVGGEDVVIASGESLTVADADMALVNSFNSLTVAAGGTLTFNLSDDADLTCLATNQGTVVKTGAGALKLVTLTTSTFKTGRFNIEEGALWCPQNFSASADFQLGPTTISSNGTLVTAKSLASNAACNTIIDGLWGDGVVTNIATGGMCQLRVMNVSTTPCVFAGRITGRGIRWYSGGNVRLTGTNSNYSGSTQIWNGYNDFDRRGVTGLMKIGNANAASSAGTSGAFDSREHGGAFLYLGDGETTNKKYNYYNTQNNEGMHMWDAGAHGGVTFTGDWKHSSSRAERLVLTGSNTAPCVVSGAWTGDDSAPTYIIKKGTGTWTFADNSNRKFKGGIAVEDGVLRFTSIAETNEVCSLGLATMLQSAYTGSYNASKDVDYAYLLGTASSRGTMEYVGSVPAHVSTRPIAVKGEGELRLAGQPLWFSGVSATSGGGKFVISGAEGTSGVLANAADGEGPLALEKDGPGAWRLQGDCEFTGPLIVKSGTLEVRGAYTNDYSWFRFNIRGNMHNHGDPSNDGNTGFTGLAFYDSEGVEQTSASNMSFLQGYSEDERSQNFVTPPDWSNIRPGQYAWARSGKYKYYTTRDIDKIFEFSTEGDRVTVSWYNTGLNPDIASTWWPILIRMPEERNCIMRFDVLAKHSSTAVRALSDWSLEASEDGAVWSEVARYDYDADTMPVAGRWFSDNTTRDASVPRTQGGYDISNITTNDPLRLAEYVSVASNALLKAIGHVPLRSLRIDCADGAGTIDGFDIPASGRLDVLNAPGGMVALPGVFLNCTDLGNVKRWDLFINGERPRNRAVAVRGDRLSIVPTGTLLIVR